MNQGNFYPRVSNQIQKPARNSSLKLTESKLLNTQKYPKNQPSDQEPLTYTPGVCHNPKVKHYLWSWLYFVLAFIVFLLVWVIGHFSIERLTDYYYFSEYNVSPYLSLELLKRAANEEQYFLSNNWYRGEQLKHADSIALSLLFSWVMWKLPLAVFTLKVVRNKGNSVQRYSTYGFFLALLLLIDIMTTIFRPEGYQSWIFFVIYLSLSILLIVTNSLRVRKKLVKNVLNFLLPILYLTLVYVSFSLLVPGIYHSIYKGLDLEAAYVIAHLFPAIDLIFYSLIIGMSYVCDSHTLQFVKMFHFLNVGYVVGHIVLFSPEEMQFYFMVGYLFVRNLAFNWIHGRVQKYVILPCAQPGWLMVYLISLSINFIPFTGVGKLVVSRSFYSQLLQLTMPIHSYTLPRDYYAYPPLSLPETTTLNPGLKSNIPIVSILIVWTINTMTQKYHISRVNVKELPFYVFGIYMFYYGLTTATQLYYLQKNSL